jgi:cell division protein FtsB
LKFTAALLLAALLGVQGQFWFGRASVAEVTQLRRELGEQQQRNDAAKQQLVRLRAELKDLREGLEMVEEKARGELGLVKPDELFVPLN